MRAGISWLLVSLSSPPRAERLISFSGVVLAFALKGLLSRPRRTLTTGRQSTGKNEPTPNERLPPRETRTKLRGPTARNPELHGQRDALMIKPSNATLKALPTNADQELPTPGGPTELKKLSHTFLWRELLQGGRDAGSAGRAGKPETSRSPKES